MVWVRDSVWVRLRVRVRVLVIVGGWVELGKGLG